MKLALLVILPPVFVSSMIFGLIWAVDPAYLRECAGWFMPLFFGLFVAFGELIVWLGRTAMN